MASQSTSAPEHHEKHHVTRLRRGSGGDSRGGSGGNANPKFKRRSGVPQRYASQVMHGWFQTEDCLIYLDESRFLDHTFNCVRGALEKRNAGFNALINPPAHVTTSAAHSNPMVIPSVREVAVHDEELTFVQKEADFRWRVVVKGKVSSGKTCLVRALCRLNLPTLHCETPGAAVYKTHWPVMFNLRNPLDKRKGRPDSTDFSQIRWVAFELCDIGARSEAMYSYLKNTNDAPSVGNLANAEGYDARLLVFAMNDRKSFEIVKNLLQTSTIHTVPTVVVGTHFDLVDSYSVTDDEISYLARNHNVPVVLVNCFANFADSEGVSNVVEVLTEALLGNNPVDDPAALQVLKQSI